MSTVKEERTLGTALCVSTRPGSAQRRLAKPSHWGLAVCVLASLCFLTPGSGSAQWVAYNDHAPSTNAAETHPNATTYNVRGVGSPNSGYLKDILTGTNLPVVLTWVTNGTVLYGLSGAEPNPGTPLYTNFHGYVYFGGGASSADASVQIATPASVTCIFSNLSPNKRYSFRGGVVRGSSSYSNRWTLASLQGALSFSSAHSLGVLTTAEVPTINTNEGAINTGNNVAGEMWDWENIDPGADGSFSVVCTQYTGPIAGGVANGTYGYALIGLRLEETAGPGAIVITEQPANTVVLTGAPFNISLRIAGALPYYYQWFKGSIPGTAITDATNQTYSVASASPSDDGFYYVVVSNDLSQATSAVVRVTITNDLPLAITSQPQSQSIPAGSPVTFTVGVTGSRPRYQWFKNSGLILNATNSSYTISSVSTNDVGNYWVRITNSVSLVASFNAALSVTSNKVALLVARTNLSGADLAISNRLAALEYTVAVQDDRTVSATNANNKALVVISASVDPTYVTSKFMLAAVPVMVWESGVYNSMNLTTATTNQGTVTAQQGLYIYDSNHPLAAGLTGTNSVFTANQALSYGIPGANAVVVAATINGADLPVLFAYEKGAFMANVPLPLPARRVGFFLENNGATNLTSEGWRLFDAAVQWATSPIAINVPVGLSQQPVSISLSEGTSGTFSVNVTGTPPYYLQWRKNGTNIAGATGRTLKVGPVTPADNGTQFTLYVTNKLPSYTTSIVATLTVLPPIPITITSQPQNLVLALGQTATFTVGLTGTSTKFQWYKDGVAIPNATNQTFTIPSVTLNDNGNYTVTVTNRVSSRTSSAAILFILPPTQVIVSTTNVWRYNATGTDLQTAWRTNGYDDSSWAEGAGVLACPANEPLPAGWTINTILPLLKADGTNGIQTYYFRTHFTWTNEPAGVSIVLSNLIDDGAIFYLNGEEISRVAMPSGNITYNTASTRGSDVSSYGPYVFNISPFLLQPGDNVLAVEVHQYISPSSDVVFGSMLGATFIPPTSLAITNQPQSTVTEETRTATFRVGVAGDGARFQWYKDDVLIPGANRDFLIIRNVSVADAGNYFVTVTNPFSSLVSRKAALLVLVDTNPPALRAAEFVGQTNILVSFSEPVSAATATNLANYAVTNYAGGTLEIRRVLLLNPTNVLLTIAAPTPGANYVLLVSHVRDASPQSIEIPANSAIPVNTVLALVSPYSYFEFYNPVPPFDEPNIGTEWQQLEFVPPPSWANNEADRGAFWLGNDPLPLPRGKELSPSSALTSYFRTWFNYQGSPWGAKLRLRHVTDSGAVFYLNGQEILRFNMPTGAVDYATPANLDILNPTWSEFIDLPVELFRSGPNLLAIELHTVRSYQATAALAVELEARLQSFPTGLPLITRQPQSQTVNENEPVTFSVAGVGATALQWFRNGTPVPGATQEQLTIANAPLEYDNSAFSVVVSNELGSALSTVAILRVVPDLTSPALVSAFALSSNQILVSFSEPVSPATATDVANYSILNSQGPNPLVSTAVVTNGTNVILTLAGVGGEVVAISNIRDCAAGENAILANSTARIGLDIDLPIDAVWKYDQSGTDFATNWRLLGFDDSGWANGAGSFWVETDVPQPRNTRLFLTNAAGQYVITYYFRIHFSSPFAVSNAQLSIRHIIDDGAVFYLNGTEFQRFNINGTPTYSTLAAATVEPPLSMGPYTTNVNLLAGENVIAIEVHQVYASSSDVAFGAEIKMTVPSTVLPPAMPGRTWLHQQSAGLRKFLWWTGRGFALEKAEALANPGQTLWTPVDVFNAPTNYYWLPATGSNAFYRLKFQ